MPASAPSCAHLSPLLLTGKGSSCWLWLHSHLVLLPGVPLFPFPRTAELFLFRSTSNGSESFYTDTWSWSLMECICKCGKFPFCILPKHLTRIKVSPQGNQFHILKPNFFPSCIFFLPLSVSDSKGMISSETKPLVLRVVVNTACLECPRFKLGCCGRGSRLLF